MTRVTQIDDDSLNRDDVAEIIEVQYLGIERDGNELLITWQPPNAWQTQCGYIRYSLSYYLDDGLVGTEELLVTTARYDVYQCATFRVEVRSVGNGEPGYSVEATYETCE